MEQETNYCFSVFFLYQKKMAVVSQNLILDFQKSSCVYPEYIAIRNEVLMAFNASLTD